MGASSSRASTSSEIAQPAEPRRKLVNAIRTVKVVAAANKPRPEKKKKGLLGKAISLVKHLGRVGPAEPEPIVGAEWRRKNRLGKAPKRSPGDDNEPQVEARGAGGAKLRINSMSNTIGVNETSLALMPPVYATEDRTRTLSIR